MDAPYPLPERVLVAVGGNATHPSDIAGTSEEQVVIATRTAESLLPLMRLDNQLVITHGNGPVVGKILMRHVLSRGTIPPMPLDICVAHSQGGIAYLLVQALENCLRRAGHSRNVACLLTQVEVDADDSAFQVPQKPIGPFFDQADAEAFRRELGWNMAEDAGRGWRHVVPSPEPQRIVELPLIRELSARGTIVVAGGGGGIPVLRDAAGVRRGVSAVIDKDLTSAHLANALGCEVLMILTAVPAVAVDFGTARQRTLDTVRAGALRAHQATGQFPPGSMGPKVEAALRFLAGGGRRVVITDLEHALPALQGETGTQVLPDDAD